MNRTLSSSCGHSHAVTTTRVAAGARYGNSHHCRAENVASHASEGLGGLQREWGCQC
jgi:hypothetical protein